jgi:hypothetical protein
MVIESLARAYPLVEYVAVVVVTYPEWICRVSAQTRVAAPGDQGQGDQQQDRADRQR